MNQFLSSSLILTLFLASTTSAAAVKRDGSYSKIHRLAIGPSLRNGVIELDRTMRKYGIEPPQELRDAATKQLNAITSGAAASTSGNPGVGGGTKSGSVVASPMLHNQEYLCPVTIGGQTLNLDVDTGSADLYAFSCSRSRHLSWLTEIRVVGYSIRRYQPMTKQAVPFMIPQSLQPFRKPQARLLV